MTTGLKNTLRLLTGLAAFALLGTILFYTANGKLFNKPTLDAGLRFDRGISAKQLGFSNNEVLQLNKSLKRNNAVVEKTILTVDSGSMHKVSSKILSSTQLKFSMKIKGRSGMIFTQKLDNCPRKQIVAKIIHSIDHGAKVLSNYSDKPLFKNKAVTIVDM